MAQPETIRTAMRRASDNGRAAPWPGGYYWAAVWWRLHAKESKFPAAPMAYSRNQYDLWRDCIARPKHYAHKPAEQTDFQWSQK